MFVSFLLCVLDCSCICIQYGFHCFNLLFLLCTFLLWMKEAFRFYLSCDTLPKMKFDEVRIWMCITEFIKGTELNIIQKRMNYSNRNVVNNITYIALFNRLWLLIPNLWATLPLPHCSSIHNPPARSQSTAFEKVKIVRLLTNV